MNASLSLFDLGFSKHILKNNFSFLVARHESRNGFYRPSAYFLAKVFCDLIPFRLIPALMFSVVSYWMIGEYEGSNGLYFGLYLENDHAFTQRVEG